jgi:hypothetical protein
MPSVCGGEEKRSQGGEAVGSIEVVAIIACCRRTP